MVRNGLKILVNTFLKGVDVEAFLTVRPFKDVNLVGIK